MAGFSCPLSTHCGSQLEFGLVRDILSQKGYTTRVTTTGQLKAPALNDAVGRYSRLSCPNEECSFFFIRPDELFMPCLRCIKNYCLTCKNSVSSEGPSDHICPLDKGITDTENDAENRLREVLTKAVGVRCPSMHCRTSDRIAALAVKEPGDCNVMKCYTCRRFFCFICSADLGRKSQEAHQAFPHR